MKLYHYPHCPFCQRVRLALGAKKHPYESVVLSYADHQTPVSLVGAKMLPIVEFDTGVVMAESLDIIYELETRFPQHQLIFDETHKNIEWASAVMVSIPRYFDLLLPFYADGYRQSGEFDEAGWAYYKDSKEQKRGKTFDDLKKERFDIFEDHVQPVLSTIVARIENTGFIGDQLSAADCVLVADMSGLRLVHDVVLPEVLIDYMDRVESLCGDQLLKV